jgi:hypothetical protein
MKRGLLLGTFGVLLLLSLLLAACGGQDPPAQLDGQALAEERCGVCHDYQRVESAAKSADAWASTVDRMIERGAQLNDAERQAVIDYLAEAHPE